MRSAATPVYTPRSARLLTTTVTSRLTVPLERATSSDLAPPAAPATDVSSSTVGAPSSQWPRRDQVLLASSGIQVGMSIECRPGFMGIRAVPYPTVTEGGVGVGGKGMCRRATWKGTVGRTDGIASQFILRPHLHDGSGPVLQRAGSKLHRDGVAPAREVALVHLSQLSLSALVSGDEGPAARPRRDLKHAEVCHALKRPPTLQRAENGHCGGDSRHDGWCRAVRDKTEMQQC